MAPQAMERDELAKGVSHALNGAELIGFNERGYVCVWTGGYGFNVYDAARDWEEIRHFTSGQMVDWSDEDMAAERMKSEGFQVIR